MTIEVLNGVRNWYGSRDAEDKLPAVVKTEGFKKEMVIDFNYDDLPTFSADGAMVLSIPANSVILSAKLYVKTAFAGSDSATATTDFLNVGLYQSDGTVIDANGLMGVDALTDLAAGAWLDTGDGVGTGQGALIGESIGAADGQVTVTIDDGSVSAGAGRVIVEYIQPKS